jgi:hypothetical protein
VVKIAGKEGAGEGEKGQKGRTNEKDAQKTRFRGFERRLGGVAWFLISVFRGIVLFVLTLSSKSKITRRGASLRRNRRIALFLVRIALFARALPRAAWRHV